jgi:CRP/FNR family transcriptional regulator, anaerobic regulatory protein
MFFNDFISHLDQNIHLNKTLYQALQNKARPRHLIKRQSLVGLRETCNDLFYIQEGFFRIYQKQDNEERTIDFANEGKFVTVVPSFFKQEPNNYGIVCEANAYVYALSYDDMHDLEQLYPDFLHLSKRITTEYLMNFYHDVSFYRTANATERYLYLCQTYPGISNIVSQKHIASYLGLAPQTLSRIIKETIRRPTNGDKS